jgi:hypothetical protein
VRVTRRLSLEPDYKPALESHSDWCRYLSTRGILKTEHRRCMKAFVCVAPLAKDES